MCCHQSWFPFWIKAGTKGFIVCACVYVVHDTKSGWLRLRLVPYPFPACSNLSARWSQVLSAFVTLIFNFISDNLNLYHHTIFNDSNCILTLLNICISSDTLGAHCTRHQCPTTERPGCPTTQCSIPQFKCHGFL